jgi:hypothetical protein
MCVAGLLSIMGKRRILSKTYDKVDNDSKEEVLERFNAVYFLNSSTGHSGVAVTI